MRGFILLVALGLAVADNDRVYTKQREYVYSYDTQVLSGIPHHGMQVSGARIKCDVRLQFSTMTRAFMKLENIEMFSVFGEMTEAWPDNGLYDSLLNPVDAAIIATLTGELSRPIKFDYVTGKIENAKAEATDPYWSVNIKRGILDAMRLNLNREDEITNDRDMMFDNSIPDWTRFASGEANSAYRVMETGICGRREAAYNVLPDATNPEMVTVTKARNFQNMDNMPMYEQGLFSYANMIPMPISVRNMIQQTSQASYVLRGRGADSIKDGFVIQSARVDSRYIITPITQEQGNEAASIIQILTLKNARQFEDAEAIKEEAKNANLRSIDLIYEWPVELNTNKAWNPEVDGDFSWAADDGMGDKIAVVDKLLDTVVSAIHPIVTAPSLIPIKQITRVMKRMTVQELTDLATKYTDAEFRKRAVVLDLIPSLMTPRVFPVLAHLITNQLVGTTRAIFSFQLAALTATPTLETLNWIAPMNEAFISHPKVAANPILFHTLILNSAATVRRFVGMAINNGATRAEIEKVLGKYIDDMNNLYKSKTAVKDRIIIVRAAANTGVPAFLPVITAVITDKTAAPMLRNTAIAAAARMPTRFLPKIQKVLLPVYMDMTEKRQVRETAFISLMDTIPGPAVLQMIIATQRREKSVHVASMVYSYMCNMARMTLPGLETLAGNVRRMLPLVRAVRAPAEYTLFGSQNFYFDTNCANKVACMGVDIFRSAPGTSRLEPSVVQARAYLHWLGKTINAVEIDAWNGGIAAVINKIFGGLSSIRGSLAGKSIPEMIEILLTPVSKLPVNLRDVADEITAIIEKLGIVDRPMSENLHVGFVLKVLGNEVSFMDITEETIRNWISTGNMPIIGNVKEFIKEVATAGLNFDIPTVLNLGTSSVQVPTTAGVPVFANVSGVIVTHFAGDITPNTGARPGPMGFNAAIKTGIVGELNGMMGVDMRVLTTGVKYRCTSSLTLPLTMDTAVNMADKTLTLTVTPPTTATEVGMYDMGASVFMMIPPGINIQAALKELDIMHPAKFEVLNIKYSTPFPYIGVTLESAFRLPVSLASWMPSVPYWPKHAAVFTVTGTEPWAITLEACINAAAPCAISWNQFTANPAIATPKVLRAGVTVGCVSRPETSKARIAINLAMSPDMWANQINVMAIVPGLTPAPVTADIVADLRKLPWLNIPSNTVGSAMPHLAVITVAMGPQTVTTTITPENPSPVKIEPFVNFAFTSFMKTILGKGATVTKEVTAATETPIVLKMVTEASNVNMRKIEWALGGVYTSLYTLLAFPNMPHLEINPATAAATNIEARFAIFPVLQKVICMGVSPNYQFLVDVPMVWLTRPAGRLLSLEKPWVVPNVPSAAGIVPANAPDTVFPRTCLVTPVNGQAADQVMTFDSAEFKVPALSAGCEVLLARDCSDAGLFNVIASGIGATKTIRVILLNNRRVDLSPGSGWFSSAVTVKVNGAPATLAEGSPVVVADKGENWIQITKAGEWINIAVRRLGLFVATNMRTVEIKTGPLYSGHLCGVCGNSNYDMMDDTMGPGMSVHPSAAAMVLKYVIPSPTCKIEDVKKTLGVATVNKACVAVERTGVVTVGGKTCFTMIPVNACPAGCVDTGALDSISAPVYCRNPNNINTKRMVTDSRAGVLDLTGRTADTTVTVEAPRACVPAA